MEEMGGVGGVGGVGEVAAAEIWHKKLGFCSVFSQSVQMGGTMIQPN